MKTATRSSALAITIAFSALAAACYSPSIPDGKLACSQNGACPDNFTCASDGFCYANGAAIPPGAPTGVSATPGVRSATVTWSAPAQNGGSAITNYTVTATPGGLSASSTTTSATLSGLDNAATYTFTVIATNGIGNSVPSDPSAPITTFGFPGVPTDLIAATTSSGATLDWTAPADSGGTPVTGYLVRESFNGAAYTQVSPAISGTHATLPNLTGGGSYTFEVAAVNAVGAGDYSDPSSAITLAAVPNTPTITAPATVSSGQTNVAASVVANLGETYAWTITGGTLTNVDGAAGEIANGTDSIAFTVTAAPGGTVVLGCIATNPVGDSTPATFTAAVSSAPVMPTIIADLNITIGDMGIVAKVAANSGMTYNWSLSGPATLASGDLHGATANGFNSITYNLSGNAQVGAQIFLQVVEVNAAQEMSPPGVLTQTIFAAPSMPIITAPLMVASSEIGATASVPNSTAMTFLWTLTGATFSSGSSAGGFVSPGSGINSIQFDVTAAVGGNVVLSVIEINAANKQSAPATATIPVGALPNPLSISVALDNGASPAQFQSGATQYATLGSTALAEVAAVTGATYLWTISSGGSPVTGETGTSRTYSFVANSASQPITLGCTVALGSSNVVGSQTVTVVLAPVTPAISLDGHGNTGFLEVGDTSSHTAAVTSPVSTSTYSWSAAPAADVVGLGTSGTSVNFTLSPTAVAGSLVLHAIETNAAGRAGSPGAGTFTVLGELQKPVIAASNQAFAPAQSYTATQSPMQSNLTYQWAIAEVVDGVPGTAVACPSTSPSPCTVNSDHSINFTVDPAIASDGNHKIELQLTVTDQAGDTQTATPLDIPVIALPAVAITFGAPPSGDAFGPNISVGGTREAFVANEADATYLWTVSSGSSIANGSTNDVTISAGAAVAGATLALQVIATNAAGSSTGNATVNVIAASAAPTVSVPAFANDPSMAAYTNQQYTATLTPGSPAGVSYRWTVANSGNTACNAAGVLCGITPITSANAGTFSYTVTAAVGSTLSFSAVAIDAAGDASAASNTATQMVIEPPATPSIATPFNSPGAPSGITFTKFAPGATYTLAVADPIAGDHYAWTIGAESCPGAAFCTDESGDATYSSIQLTADSSITSVQGHSPPQVGDTVSIVVTAIDSNNARTSSQPVVISVIAAPTAPAIVITDPEHPAGLNPATQQLSPGDSDTAYADSDPSLTFAWTATDAEQASVLTSSASGTAGTLSGGQSINEVSFVVPAFTSGEALTFGVTVYNDASFASATPVTIAVNGSTPAAVDVPALDADLRSPHALTFGAQHIKVDVTPDSGDSFNCFPLDGNITVENPNNTAMNGSTTSPFFIDVSSNPTVDGPQYDTRIECDELVTATGATLTTTTELILSPPLTVVSITPADGSSDVGVTTNPTILFSYPPDPSTLHIDASCDGSVSIFNTGDATCPGFTFQQDTTNKALFTAVHTTPFETGATYLITVATNASGPVADLQGVPLGQGLSSTFATHAVPAIDSTTIAVTPHLQSLDLAWTNPTDAARDHVNIGASWSDTDSTPHTASVSTTSASQSMATISGIDPAVPVSVTFQACDNAGCTVASTVTTVSTATAFSGLAVDFPSSQTVTGLGPNFDGTGAASFSLIWDSLNLYAGFAQASSPTALPNDGDALWIGIDIDGAGDSGNGQLADINGESFTPTGTGSAGLTSAGVADQIIWPFRADYVVELKRSGTALVANLRTVAASAGSQWQPISAPVDFNGALAEIRVTPQLLGGDVHYNARFAMAFLNTAAGVGTTIDLAPAAYSSTITDGHTPATDVLGKLASITNSFDPQGLAFRLGTTGNPHIPIAAAHLTPAMSLVTFSLDATVEEFDITDLIKLNGSLAPFSYTSSDSQYAMADDGTRGDPGPDADDIYTGVFNLGIFDAATAAAAGPFFFEFTDNGAAESPFGSGKDRVWTLSGGSEEVGGSDGIVYSVVYDLTHTFTLDFNVNGIPGAYSPVVILGDQPEIGDWNSDPFAAYDPTGTGGGAPLALSAGTGTVAVSFSNHDFVSRPGPCANSPNASDSQGCPLNWKGVGQFDGNSSYEDPEPSIGNGNDSMNDDVINSRVLTWIWNTQPAF